MKRHFWAAAPLTLYRFKSAELRDLYVYEHGPVYTPWGGWPPVQALRSDSARVQAARRAARGFLGRACLPPSWLYVEPFIDAPSDSWTR